MKETWNQAEISEDIKPVNYVNADSWNAAELNEAINLFGINYPVDTWNPAELDEKARNIINDITSTKTITGNPILFKTINGGYAKSCEVTFSPIQSGSGDPSPENVRPISGRDSVHLYQDTEQTETPETTHTATFSDTVYGGTWKVTEGKAIITHKIVSIDGSDWTGYPESDGKFYCGSVIGVNEAAQVETGTQYISNMYNFNGNGGTSSGQVTTDKRFYGQRLYGRFWVYDSDYSNNLAGFKTMLNTTPLQICYPLETPQEITLTPETIALLKGNNVLFTDGDSIELKYTKLELPDDSDSLSLSQKVKKAIELIKGKEIKEETKKSTTKGRRKKS